MADAAQTPAATGAPAVPAATPSEAGQTASTVQSTDGTAPAAAPEGFFGGGMMWILVVWVGVLYFFFMRPQKKRERERREAISSLKKGDKVVTIGGIHGTIVGMGNSHITIKVDDKTGTTLKMLRTAVNIAPEGGESDEAEVKA